MPEVLAHGVVVNVGRQRIVDSPGLLRPFRELKSMPDSLHGVRERGGGEEELHDQPSTACPLRLFICMLEKPLHDSLISAT